MDLSSRTERRGQETRRTLPESTREVMEDMDDKPEDYDPKDSIKEHAGYPGMNNAAVQAGDATTNELSFDYPLRRWRKVFVGYTRPQLKRVFAP